MIAEALPGISLERAAGMRLDLAATLLNAKRANIESMNQSMSQKPQSTPHTPGRRVERITSFEDLLRTVRGGGLG